MPVLHNGHVATLECPQCGNEFEAYRHVERRTFCSPVCRVASHRKPVPLSPGELEHLYVEEKWSIEQIAAHAACSVPGAREALVQCGIHIRRGAEAAATRDSSGPRNANWRGGRVDRKGYWAIRVPEHAREVRGYVLEHIIVWEEAHGPLPDGWVIHHLNGARKDNRDENLAAMPSRHHALVIPALQSRILSLEELLADGGRGLEGGTGNRVPAMP